MKKLNIIFMFILILILASCSSKKKNSDDELMWSVIDETSNNNVDVFFVAPTATTGSGLLEYTEKNLSKFKGAVLMEKGIYDTDARFYAPLYHQVLLDDYYLSDDELNKELNEAYKDVNQKFKYYLKNINKGNKIILAGFSQGADMCLRLLSDYVIKDEFYNKFIACYAIGWKVTNNYLSQNDRLKVAQGEDDQKVIISINTESPNVNESFIIRNNEYSYSINPLSWTTSNDVASKDLNKGAVFLDTRGNITKEVNNFTGCYIDDKRGTIKVTDVDSSSYKTNIALFPEGVYHLYDYQFFYNDLKENVSKRINRSLQ